MDERQRLAFKQMGSHQFVQGKPKPAFNTSLIKIGKYVGLLLYYLDKRHRHIVQTNLELGFPAWSRERVKQVSKRVFINMGMMAFEILRASTFSRQELIDAVHFEDDDLFKCTFASSKGGIVVSAHFGNWEIGLLYLSCRLRRKIVSIARPIDTQLIDRWLFRFRTRFGNTIIDKKKSLSHLRKALREGHIIATMIDQEPKGQDGLPITFFGKEVSASGAVALLAKRYDVPVIPLFCVRKPDGSMALLVYPPVPMQRTLDARADLVVNTQRVTDIIETVIREYPEQWFWAHKRWKKHYPHLYPDLAARERRRALKRLNASSTE